MHFSQIAAFATAAATLASANSIRFLNQDDTKRTVVFTPSAPHEAIASVVIEGNNEATVQFPTGWIGNAYAVREGDADKGFGMLAEVAFDAWLGMTYFDVSAIVDPTDTNNVMEMYPASQADAAVKELLSGCSPFPCNNAYYLPDDVQTKVTQEHDLITTLGTPKTVAAREVEARAVDRKYVTGQY